MSSEPPATAAVVLPDRDNSPMYQARGPCAGPGVCTGSHCVPAMAQRLLAPTGFTGGDHTGITGTPSPSWDQEMLESLASAPGTAVLSPRSGKGSGAAPGSSPHHSPTLVVLGRDGSPGAGRASLAPRAELWDVSNLPTHRAGCSPSIHPHRGAGSPPGQPKPWSPARGSGDSQSCPTIAVLSSLAAWERGCREESGTLAEPSLGRAVPWQDPSWPEGPSAEPDPACGSSAASSRRRQRWADPARCRTPARGTATAQDSSQGHTAKGQGLGTVEVQRELVPTCAARCKHTSPRTLSPRNSGHCCHYCFLLFIAFVHTWYKTLLFQPPCARLAP